MRGSEVLRVVGLTAAALPKQEAKKIDDLVIKFGKSNDPDEMEKIEKELLALAGKNEANAKKVVDSVSSWLRKQEGKPITAESEIRQLYAVELLGTIGSRAGKGSSLRNTIIEVLKKVAKGKYPLPVETDAYNTLVEWKVPGYKFPVD